MSRCPQCGAPEVDASTPSTVYSCGSSDYDQRPSTFRRRCAMSKELDEKWAELVAVGRAEWMPGMLDQAGYTFLNSADGGLWEVPRWEDIDYGWGWAWLPVEGRLPDWSDPATLGALLGQVRESHGNPRLYIEPNGDEGWGLASTRGMIMHHHRVICAATEAGVCLRALEVAP